MNHLLIKAAFVPLLMAALVACPPDTNPKPTTPVAVPKLDPQTRVADEETRQALTSLSFDNAAACSPQDPAFPLSATQNTLTDVRGTPFVRCEGRFVFARTTPFLAALKPGNLLVGEPGPGAPYGYLQRVKSVTPDGAKVIVTSEQAGLDDAMIEGEFDQKVTLHPSSLARVAVAPGVFRNGMHSQNLLKPQESFALNINTVLYDADGNPGTTNDQVRLKGSFNLDVDNGLETDLTWKKILGVPIYPNGIYVKMAYGYNERASVRVETDLNVDNFNKEVELARYIFDPIIIYLPIPVVIVPTVRVTADLKGNLKAQIAFGASETLTARAGFEYNDGFKNITDLKANFSKYLDVKTVAAVVEGGLNLKGDMLLYGLVGPYASVRAAVTFDAAIPRDPIWTLSASVQGYAGIHADLLVKTLDYDAKVFDVSLGKFAQSDPLPPTLTISSPRNGSQIQRNAVLPGGLCVSADDIQIGQLPAQITANGNPVGTTTGALLGNCLALPTSVFSRLGPVTFTAKVTNNHGQSSSATSSVTVVNTPPTLTLQRSGDPLQGETYSIFALVKDINELDASLLCVNTRWSVDAPDTLSSATGCDQKVTFGAMGSRQVRVTTQDSDGATASQTLMLNVQPPPVNPYPRILGNGVYARDFGGGVGGLRSCSDVVVNSGSTIDLRQDGCTFGIFTVPPPRYSASVAVENPSNETLTYDWKLLVKDFYGVESELITANASSKPSLEMKYILLDSNGAPLEGNLVTRDCEVTLKVNAPDPKRSKGPLAVWGGKCSYELPRPR